MQEPPKPPPAQVRKGQKFKMKVYQWAEQLLLMFSPCCYRRLRVSLVDVTPRQRKITHNCKCPRCRGRWIVTIYKVKGKWGPKATIQA